MRHLRTRQVGGLRLRWLPWQAGAGKRKYPATVQRVYRNKINPPGCLLIGVWGLVMVAYATPGVLSAHGTKALLLWPVYVGLAGLSVWSLPAGWLLRVVVTDGAESFVIHNFLKRHDVRWSDVVRFEVELGYAGIPTVAVRLRNGRVIKCHALSGRFLPRKWGTTGSFLEQFNAMLQERRAVRT
jgi:hypothetical protein